MERQMKNKNETETGEYVVAYRVLNVEWGCHEVLYVFLKVINIESSLCWPFQIVTLLGDSLLT